MVAKHYMFLISHALQQLCVTQVVLATLYERVKNGSFVELLGITVNILLIVTQCSEPYCFLFYRESSFQQSQKLLNKAYHLSDVA